MSILVKIQSKGQVTLPVSLRSQAGISEGDLVEAAFRRGKIVLTPKVVIDSSTFPTADDEYTPAQRRIIDARLAKSTEDIREGRTYGPFETHEQMMEFLHSHASQARRKKSTKPKPR